jgi:formylglycine-generating enzyme required for sulfatase activity
VTAFDTLFWLLIVMLAVVAYAIEAGIAARNRTAVLTTLFSVIGTILYIMVIGDENSFGRSWSMPGMNAAGPAVPKENKKEPSELSTLPGMDILKPEAPTIAEAPREVPRAPFNDCDNCPSMIGVFAGTFTMGSPETEPGRRETEGPIGVTIVNPFAVGRFEVTRDQFAAFVEETKYPIAYGCIVNGRPSNSASWHNPGFEQSGSHPVVCISWRDAKAYVAWLSKRSKKTYRLLSEAEWEYMARAGAKTAYFAGEGLSPSNANFNRARDGTIPVGFTTANQFSIHDVLGNVWEMVEDCWNPDLAFNNQDGRATVLRGNCSQRVIRGGAWDSTTLQARLAARSTVEPTAAANTVGFRVARVLD